MSMRAKILGIGRFVGAVLPFVIACYCGVTYGRAQTVETRLSALEIETARHDERWLAVVARIDAIDRTIWWLIMVTVGSTGVSGVVAVDRAAYKWRGAK